MIGKQRHLYIRDEKKLCGQKEILFSLIRNKKIHIVRRKKICIVGMEKEAFLGWRIDLTLVGRHSLGLPIDTF